MYTSHKKQQSIQLLYTSMKGGAMPPPPPPPTRTPFGNTAGIRSQGRKSVCPLLFHVHEHKITHSCFIVPSLDTHYTATDTT